MKTLIKWMFLIAIVFTPFMLINSSYACSDCGYRCEHDCWQYGHEFIVITECPSSCVDQGYIDEECRYCYVEQKKWLPLESHDWSFSQWLLDPWGDGDMTECHYGRYCESCGEFKASTKTVKKGKTKQILPKKFTRGAKKIKVKYNKKKVKATKKGKVKGKKRKTTASITWCIKYKWAREWEYYTVKVKVK